jgi:dTDP-4-amino-4,6-dideoxy-D-galactose acyltransferase
MSDAATPIERLEWDSNFFGFGVGRVAAARLAPRDAVGCARRARELGLRCLYFLADPGDPESWRAAIDAGFDPIDIRVELDRELPLAGPTFPDCALAGESDLSALIHLARGAFTESRFFRDRRFPAGKAEELFSLWVRRGVSHSDGFTVLSRSSGEPSGFVSARITSIESGRIELVAVSPALRGQGVGLRLLGSCMGELARRGARRISVVTQGSNAAAQRLYERAGFRTRSVGLWFHGWY